METSMTDTLEDEDRKVLKAADLAKLDNSDFAYIDSKGGQHLPIHDEAHVRAALARFTQTAFDTPADKAAAAKKILAKAKSFGIEVDPDSPVGQAARSEDVDGEERVTRKPRHTRDLALETKFRREYSGDIEIRSGIQDASTGANLVELSGRVIGYDTPYEVHDRFGTFTETIHRGACEDLLSRPGLDVCFLVGHDSSVVPLARTGAKASLELTEDSRGVNVRALIDPRMTGAQDLLVGLENGTISQMSVGMQVDPQRDVWSGSDADGFENKRDIYRLANIFDASAVAMPANPNTALELASVRMQDFPPEVTVRVKHLENLAKRGSKGLLTQEDSDALLNVIRRLFSSDAERSAPTAQDPHIADAITAAHQATGAAIAAQAKDSDNNSDPVDKQVMDHLDAAHKSVTAALQAQASDGTPDADGGPDGSQNANDPSPASAQDGTGSRGAATATQLRLEIDLLKARRRVA